MLFVACVLQCHKEVIRTFCCKVVTNPFFRIDNISKPIFVTACLHFLHYKGVLFFDQKNILFSNGTMASSANAVALLPDISRSAFMYMPSRRSLSYFLEWQCTSMEPSIGKFFAYQDDGTVILLFWICIGVSQ